MKQRNPRTYGNKRHLEIKQRWWKLAGRVHETRRMAMKKQPAGLDWTGLEEEEERLNPQTGLKITKISLKCRKDKI